FVPVRIMWGRRRGRLFCWLNVINWPEWRQTMNEAVMDATRAEPDALLVEMADYVLADLPASEEAYATARWCLLDSLGCAMLALQYPACVRVLGPIVPGAVLPGGARVPGTRHELDPVQAAFNIGAMIRWLDYNDTW